MIYNYRGYGLSQGTPNITVSLNIRRSLSLTTFFLVEH